MLLWIYIYHWCCMWPAPRCIMLCNLTTEDALSCNYNDCI
ncbi:hypothetical protein GLYMA_19G136650v4 [Glycine max]|nr:hypothetical protein GLYMA_19G136650v4 [Glycine max]